jgi:hypothetical protein
VVVAVMAVMAALALLAALAALTALAAFAAFATFAALATLSVCHRILARDAGNIAALGDKRQVLDGRGAGHRVYGGDRGC